MNNLRRSIATIISFLALGGCGDNQGVNSQAGGGANAPVTSVAVDPLGPRYVATLKEGIDLRRPGYPTFLVAVSGMSGSEPWGRWSDSKLVLFKFKQPLPVKFTLTLTGGAYGPNIGQPFIVKAGVVTKELSFPSDPFLKPTSQSLSFQLKDPVDVLEINVPQPTLPQTGDARKLGIGIITLKIEG